MLRSRLRPRNRATRSARNGYLNRWRADRSSAPDSDWAANRAHCGSLRTHSTMWVVCGVGGKNMCSNQHCARLQESGGRVLGCVLGPVTPVFTSSHRRQCLHDQLLIDAAQVGRQLFAFLVAVYVTICMHVGMGRPPRMHGHNHELFTLSVDYAIIRFKCAIY